MQLYFTPYIKEIHYLDKIESSHLVKVMRKDKGDQFYSTDGKGSKYVLEIVEANPKKLLFKIVEEEIKEQDKAGFHLYIAFTKNMSRIEWLLEKCTEIGIAAIHPVLCEKSERKHFRKDRLERILIAAIKQSQRYYLPHLFEMVKLKEAIEMLSTTSNLIATFHPDNKFLEDVLDKGISTSVFIGPEGDFSKKELNFANEKGIKSVNLSISRLRTETAALVACQIFSSVNR